MSFNDSQSRKGKDPIKDNKPPASDADALLLASRIAEILQGKSHKTVQKALAAIAAVHNLKVMAIDKPIGLITGTPTNRKDSGNSQKSSKKGAKGKDPELDKLSKDRSVILAEVKASTGANVEELKSKLRDAETRIKEYKLSTKKGTAPTTSAQVSA